MTPAEFFDRAKTGDSIKLGNDPEPWKVLRITKGSHAHIAKKNDEKSTFIYLSGLRLRFENLRGRSFDKVEFL